MPDSLLKQAIMVDSQENPNTAIVWLHGLGADGNDFVPVVEQLPIAEKRAIRFIFPNAPTMPVTINMGMAMRAWYDFKDFTFGVGEDLADIQRSIQALTQLLQELIDQGFAPRNIILAGFSQGGVIALHTALRFQPTLGGVLALSTYLPLQEDLLPESVPQDLAIFQAHGNQDPTIPTLEAHKAAEWLTDQGIGPMWFEYPMPHSVCQQEIMDINRWLEMRLL